MTFIYIGVDDTDNLESRGTGHLTRGLAKELAASKLVEPISITRHQLFFDPRIPYTSHNSSLCLLVETEETPESISTAACAFVSEHCAEGSDAAVCVAGAVAGHEEIVSYSKRAKGEVLTQAEARELAGKHGIMLRGLSGTEDGVIGALAGIGLRATGCDGRCPWLPGIRELTPGNYQARDLLEDTGIEGFYDVKGNAIFRPEMVMLSENTRPVMMDGMPVLLVEKTKDGVGSSYWRAASKPYVKQH